MQEDGAEVVLAANCGGVMLECVGQILERFRGVFGGGARVAAWIQGPPACDLVGIAVGIQS